LECNFDRDDIMWHRRETRRQTEKTNLILQPGESPTYSHSSEITPVQKSLSGLSRIADLIGTGGRPMGLGKQWVNAPNPPPG
jgi:hypothetical protein